MALVRRTVYLPQDLAARLDQEAIRRRISFSRLIVELLQVPSGPLPYAATIEDEADLSLRIEEILRRRGVGS